MDYILPIIILAAVVLLNLLPQRTKSRKDNLPECPSPAPSRSIPVDESPADEQEDYPPPPCSSDMLLRCTGQGEKIHTRLCSRSSRRVQWVSREAGADGQPLRCREPRESVRTHPVSVPFTAAGKVYSSAQSIAARRLEDGTFLDRYGRRVICLRERFPCFDSYDYANEKRCYRWYLILEPERLTRVYAEDGGGELLITEDVSMLEDCCVEELRRLGLLV